MSMRTKTLFQNLFMMLAVALFVGCSKDAATEPTPVEKPESTVEVEVKAITDTTIEFEITSTNVDKVQYVFLESVDPTPTRDFILEAGDEVTPNAKATLLLEDLNADTEHTIYVVATSGKSYLEAKASAKTEEAVEYPATDLKIYEGDITDTTATFIIATANAEVVKYMVKLADADYPTAEEWETDGIAVEPNVEKVVTVTGLEAETEYFFAVMAAGKGQGSESVYPFATCSAPQVTATLGDFGTDYAEFTVDFKNVSEVKYVCIEAGTRDVTVDQVLKNGTSIDGTNVRVDGLKEGTDYEIYVAVKNVSGSTAMADVLSFTTEKEIKNYLLTEGITASSYKYGDDNYFVTFVDEKNGYTLKVDFYTDNSQPYLTSAVYILDGANACKIGAAHTKFFFSSADTTGETFASGDLEVIATPNEDTREINYTIGGILRFANGDYVYLRFEGVISGISLPEVIEGAPEGAYVFEVSPSTNMPKRVHGSNLQAGEYYIKFYDSSWNELTLDLFVDPALCDNGNDGLPAGKYTTADGSFDTYSNVALYNPYFSGNFTEAELMVDKDGDNYTFTLLGTVVSGATEKLVYMKYTGEIAEMVK